MIETLLNKQIIDKVKQRFLASGYVSEFIEIRVNNAKYVRELDINSSYFLVSDKIDIRLTSVVKIASDSNFITISKQNYEFVKYRNPDSFEGSEIRVTTEDFQTSFIGFSLVFLKITPYNS